MNTVIIFTAFIGGIVSFLAPCVLPIIPGFLAYLAGSGVDGKEPKRKDIFLNSIFFVLGFSVVFAILGVLLNSVLINVAYEAQSWLSKIGGILIIFFGLYLVGLIRVPFLDKDYKIGVKKKFSSRFLTSFVFGFAFAAGWTPCVGPVLGIILGLATSQPTSAFILLLVYALGLGLPFLLVGLFTAQAIVFINKYSRQLKYVNIVFGFILVVLGILVFTQTLSLVANFDFLNKILVK